MTNEEVRKEIKKVISKMDENELVELYNDYCLFSGKRGNRIYKMDKFDNYLCDCAPSVIINVVSKDFNIFDMFFMFNESGKLVSLDCVLDIININDIVNFIMDKEETLCNTKIRLILEQLDHTTICDKGVCL